MWMVPADRQARSPGELWVFGGRGVCSCHAPKWGREAGEQCAGSDPELGFFACGEFEKALVEMSRRSLEVWRANLDQKEELGVLV